MKARSLSLVLSLLLAGSAHAAVTLETSSEALRVDPAAAPKVEHWHSGTKAAAVAPLLQLPALASERAAAALAPLCQCSTLGAAAGSTRSASLDVSRTTAAWALPASSRDKARLRERAFMIDSSNESKGLCRPGFA